MLKNILYILNKHFIQKQKFGMGGKNITEGARI